MNVFVLVLSRLVPMLLFLSVCLVAARWSHDRLLERSSVLARTVFWSVLVLGLVALVPYVMQLRLLISATRAFARRDWAEVDGSLQRLRDLGGHEDRAVASDWATALMNMGRFHDAEAVLLEHMPVRGGVVATQAEDVVQLGICRYYAGSYKAAYVTLHAIGDTSRTQLFLRDYFIARCSEKLGRPNEALQRYTAAARRSSSFVPAVYQLARMELQMGQREEASRAVALLDARTPQAQSIRRYLLDAIAAGGRVSDREFIIVQN